MPHLWNMSRATSVDKLLSKINEGMKRKGVGTMVRDWNGVELQNELLWIHSREDDLGMMLT